ncbi:ABC transporter permease [Streptococcus gallolyticus]|nr:ABC transporter permease [Streptococcus gallolyticus]MBY5040260.1 ABC transporter permease [Streptococcus gallolyticus]
MKTVFQQRRQLFLSRCAKYLRYVLNDHFVLVLMVLLGFLLVQYRELLLHFPANPWYVYLLILAVLTLLFFVGQPASYLEDADQLFLLVKENQVKEELGRAAHRAFLTWGGLLMLGYLFFFPLYLKLNWSPLVIAVVLLALLIGKFFWHQRQIHSLLTSHGLNWSRAISKEDGRKQRILQFFALFTTVKGITSSVKRRSYLDFLLGMVKKEKGKTWDYLFLRAFLRSGDFYPLTLRLLGMSLIFLVTLKESLLATGLTVLFDYLLLFQLLPLYKVYDYQYLAQLYPLSSFEKRQSCKRVIGLIFYAVLFLQAITAVMLLTDKKYIFFIVGIGIILQQIYLPIKAKKLFD